MSVARTTCKIKEAEYFQRLRKALMSQSVNTVPSQVISRDDQASRRDLDRSLIRGIAWTSSVKLFSQILSWVSTLIVIRLLNPEDYGLIGMAMVYLGLVALINEFGLGSAIITQRELTDDQLGQINTLCVFLGLAGFMVSCLAAYPVALFFRTPDLEWVIIVMSLTFVISGFQTAPSALLHREMRFKLLAFAEGLQAAGQALATVALAFFGYHYWALVVGGILGTSLSTGVISSRRGLRFVWPRLNALGDALTFSWQILVTRITWIVMIKTDYLIAGRMLGQTELGVYSVASTIAQIPLDKITGLVSRVSFPLFSAVRHEKTALRRYVLSLTEGLALITFPLAFGLALVTEEFVGVVLGEKWSDAIQPLRLLAILIAIRAIFPVIPQVLIVLGEARFIMYVGIVTTVVLPFGVYLGAQWGIVGIAVALCVIHPLNAIPMYWRFTKTLNLTMREYVRALWPALSTSFAMVLFVLFLKAILPAHWPLAVHFGVQVLGGATAYGLTALIVHRERLLGFVQLVRSARS